METSAGIEASRFQSDRNKITVTKESQELATSPAIRDFADANANSEPSGES